ncbi:hypothetical protein Aple_095250 [Acrocarpospora pleiomorpha]|uniref:Uncharacterized protein n=1 Tax=Acrocarpospora pleiomorpha TaxID=90975 RepID=A0A5M3Y095_9ACTN|nr:hypothetical protein [Acrocarpospora pleiomorpha]GES26626.1 hypothetical protein Aple_095250 [Acrocarpospora pleiomorpha]
MTRVFITDQGDKHHFSPECRSLTDGRQSGEVQGYKLNEIRQVDLAEASTSASRSARDGTARAGWTGHVCE